MRSSSLVFALALIHALLPPASAADPVVPGFTVETYAAVDRPVRIAFDDSGHLFVGRNVSTGQIARVAPGGVASLYGPSLADPDAVIPIDPAGLVAGAPGSVIAGGIWDSSSGHITEILPDESGQVLWGPSSAFHNPSDFAYDSSGRLLLVDFTSSSVLVSTGGFPTVLCAVPSPAVNLAVDDADNVYVASNDGVIRVYDSSGALVNGLLVDSLNGIVAPNIGPGGAWGNDLITIGNGMLLSIAPDGTQTVLGTGFPAGASAITGAAFGPDGALYYSVYAADEIFRIVPEPVASPVVAASPLADRLHQNAPNPFTGFSTVAFSLDRPGHAQVDVFDAAGRRVDRLHSGALGAGRHSLRWTAEDAFGRPLATGTYFYRLTVDGHLAGTRKAVVVR